MDFDYEVLGDQRFQKLSQALIVAQYPNAQCLPVRQPDGGRDAFAFRTEFDQNELVIFQVKFSSDPSAKNEREIIQDVIKSEKKKVENLISKGAARYVLVTNVRGTAHLDVGTIDKVNEALTNEFNIPSQVWWRDDLDRRLENSKDIRWCYPEILKATDILPLLLEGYSGTVNQEVMRALKSYMATQYSKDRDVKFKQVDLKRELTDLFVDLPLGHKRQRTDRGYRRSKNFEELSEIDAYISQLDIDEHGPFDQEYPFDHSSLAGAFLLNMPSGEGVSRLVLEGAPGQGKSTVTQFLCQVNRLRLLRKDQELATLNDLHKTGIVRTPFRLDMRDYAVWVSGRNPFLNSDKSTSWINGMTTLESFLVKQVEVLSGGMKFTTSDLVNFFAQSHSIVVLDGFDEVADVEIRNRIVEEICETATRLDSHAKSLQIIVTSRPAAFANSPGFPEDEWVHLELKDLNRKIIEVYKDKWIEVQALDEDESNQVSSILEDKLEQPHLRDLARNPMQLTILLHLIHVQGVALPEKRTMLYDEYMKLFFHREAEKSKIVRERGELLLSIHGMLAWVLHTQVENGAGTGSITKNALLDEVRTYLETEEHDTQLADELFEGTVERVGVLVSREEGLFEFEVQPLREYFAARYLYKTAPYSPQGHKNKGTKPDRFEALARSFYWTNVTRFFCGFYDRGELSSLVDGITSLAEDDKYGLINQPRQLAMMLLSDQVFTQSPRIMKRLIAFITKEPGFQRFICMETLFRYRSLTLSPDVGGDVLFEICAEKLTEVNDSSHRRALLKVMAQNANNEKLKSIWTSRCSNDMTPHDLFCEAKELGIAESFTPEEIATAVKKDTYCHLRWLIVADHYEMVEEDSCLRSAAKYSFFNGELKFHLRWDFPNRSVTTFEALTELLQLDNFVKLITIQEKNAPVYTIFNKRYFPEMDKFLEQIMQSREDTNIDSLDLFKQNVIELFKKDVEEWQECLEPWATLVDYGLDESPSNYIVSQIAVIATASEAKSEKGVWDEDGFSATKGLVNRLYFARHKCDDSDWWHMMLQDTNSELNYLYLAVLLFWGSPETIASLEAKISPIIDELSPTDWSRLWILVHHLSRATGERRIPISEDWFQSVNPLTPRIALILLERVNDLKIARRLSHSFFLHYIGPDPEILIRAAQIELKGAEKEKVHWDYLKQLSERLRELDIHRLFLVPRFLRRKIPKAVARNVLTNFELHNDQFVVYCENAYASIVAVEAFKVSAIAETDGWFTSSY